MCEAKCLYLRLCKTLWSLKLTKYMLLWSYYEKAWAFVLNVIIQMMDGQMETCIWWHHQMETFSALLALCEGKFLVTGEFPSQRPVTQSFDVFFGLCLNKWLSKQWWGWWFETPSHSLWRHYNDVTEGQVVMSLTNFTVWFWFQFPLFLTCTIWLGNIPWDVILHIGHVTPLYGPVYPWYVTS